MLGLFRNRHRTYEALLHEHLDGRLGPQDEGRLQRHLASCDACATELRELDAVRSALRSEPMVQVPRSFALPYAPRLEPAQPPVGLGWNGGRLGAALRSMQVATATAAVVLIALIGLNVADRGGTVNVPVAQLESALEADAESGFTSAEENEALRTMTLPPTSDAEVESDPGIAAAGSPSAGDARVTVATPDNRTVLDWIVVGLGAATAVLALGVVALTALTWTSRRR